MLVKRGLEDKMKHTVFKRLLSLLLIVGLALSGCTAGDAVYTTGTMNATITANNQTLILPAGNITIIIIAGNTTGNITW